MGLDSPKAVKTMKSLKDKAGEKAKKRREKKNELAQSALSALGQLGYARAGLRDIASLSGVSLGMIHYYFEDKNQLVSYAIGLFKTAFIDEMEAVFENAAKSPNPVQSIVESLIESIDKDAEIHRLWYDFRAQAMYEESFHQDVLRIEDSLVDLIVRHADMDDLDPIQFYISIDAVFRYAIHRKLMGLGNWKDQFRGAMERVLKVGFSAG